MADNLDDLLQEEKEDVTLPHEEKLGRLTSLARRMLDLQKEVEELQVMMKARQEVLDVISEREIPELMHEVGAKEIKLITGQWLKIAPFYSGKITDPSCYTWLQEHGYGDIVKTNITVTMRMSEEEKAQGVRKLLHDNDIDWDENNGVHHSTLKSWLKDTISSGKPVDRDLFNVFTGWKTTIK